MTGLDLRPLSLGDILDRTFSLYRRHFLPFMGISGIPQVLVLALSLSQTALQAAMPRAQLDLPLTLAFLALYIPIAVVAYLFDVRSRSWNPCAEYRRSWVRCSA
jgi:hypothetical protein